MFLIYSVRFLLLNKEYSNTVPVVLSVWLFGITLPVNRDAIAADSMIVDQCIGNRSCTSFRKREVVLGGTGLPVGVRHDVHASSCISFEVFSCIVYANLLSSVNR